MAHTHYKGMGKVHSFRGLLGDGKQEKIRIQGPVGAIAWRIVKLELFAETPGTTEYEHLVKVYREKQTSIVATVNFNEDELLAVSYLEGHAQAYYLDNITTVFDNAIFTRNIYITHDDIAGSLNCNYYIELEEVKVSKAGMAQLAVAAARRTID